MKNDLLARDETSRRRSTWPLFVVFTTVQNALLSLQAVDRFTSDLATQIHLLVPDYAKCPGALVTPMMLADFAARYFMTMVPHKSNYQVKVTHYLAESEDLWEIVPPQSLIIVTGAKHRFRPSPEQRLACKLQQAGHKVIFFSAQSLTNGFFVPCETEHEADKRNSFFGRWKLSVPPFRLS